MTSRSTSFTRTGCFAAALAILVLTTGCSLHKARKALESGNYFAAASAYREVLRKDPTNIKARIGYRTAAQRAAEEFVTLAQRSKNAGNLDQAFNESKEALKYDPTNAMALELLAELNRIKQEKQEEEEQDLAALKAEVMQDDVLKLNPRSPEGMNFNFSKKQSLREILANLSQAFSVSITLHTSFTDVQLAADLRGLTFQRMLDTLMMQSDHFYRVLGPNSIMVFKDTPANQQKYQAQLTKTFYLSNAEINDVKNVFNTLITESKVFTDKRNNALLIKCKPSDLAIAQRIVDTMDKPKAEVMVYLELLEVNEESMERVGLTPAMFTGSGVTTDGSLYRIGATLDNPSNLNQNKGGVRITRSDVRFLLPNLALDALKSSGDAKLVANPNVRVASGENSEVNFGSKVSTTQNSLGNFGGTSGSIGGTSGVGGYPMAQTSYGYEEVGVKIKVEPRVHHDRNISLKIDAMITTLLSSSDPNRPNIGQRKVVTFTRLQDGETAVFAGLIKEDEQKTLQGIWGLSDLPVIGRLLGNTYKKRTKSDVILTVRTVIVRSPEITRRDMETFDPERGLSDEGHFSPKKAKASAKPAEGDARKPAEGPIKTPPPAKPDPSKPELAKPESGKPEAPKPAPSQPKPTQDPQPAVPPTATTPEGGAKPKDEPSVEPAERPKDSDLVLFVTPLSTNAQRGEKVQLSVLVSGGKGITGGQFNLKLDNRLKLSSAVAGEFLTQENGTLSHQATPDGRISLSFNRKGSNVDSGALVVLELDVTGAPGNAPVLIMDGRYLVGSNPIPARVVNALVIVE